MTAWRALAMALLALCMSLATHVHAAGITVTGAWIAAGPPVVRVNAGYLRIENTGGEDVIVMGITSPRFARVEIHRTDMQNGMNSMRRLERVEVPAGGTLEFTPGALHLMLFDAAAAPVVAEEIPLTLLLEDGQQVPFTAVVRRPDAGASHHEHHH